MTPKALAEMTTSRLAWEVEVCIPKEMRETTNARRLARLRRDRDVIAAELSRRQITGTP